MKQVFRLSVAALALILVSCVSSLAQTASVDPFITQLTSSPTDSFAHDISGNGRFVVVVSTGDIATEKIPSKNSDGTPNPNARNNEDGNSEIFLVDYAQRRSFQITNTRHALKDPNGSTTARNNIQVEIINHKAAISNDGRWIVFSSNATLSGTALNPGDFNGNTHSAALASDANTEIFLYKIPPYAEVDLSSGVDVPLVPLSGGTFIRATDTPASVQPKPGNDTTSPIIADDNRDASINDNGSVVAFVSTRDLIPGHNAEVPATPEIFLFNRTTGGFAQLTETEGFFTFNENPTISGAPPPANIVVSFTSNGNLTGNNEDLNSEIHYATFNGGTTALTQVTRTTRSSSTPIVNVLNPGRRLSRNGNLIAFESTANLTGDGAIQSTFAIFIFDIAANRFIQVGPRSTPGTEVAFRFPTFTGDSSTIIFTSALNLNTDGTIATTGGLNPNNRVQVFSSPVPAAPSTTISLTRLTDVPAGAQVGRPSLQTYASNTRERIAFTTGNSEFGTGNTDKLVEAYYLLARPGTAATASVAYFTGASARPVVAPSPTPTPPAVAGLAPGMLAIATSNVALAPSNQESTNGSNQRLPPLPIELNGVTMSINGAACGLTFVGNSPSEIKFVVPIGLAPTTTDPYPVVINNNGTVIRSTIHIARAQPDIFSTTGGAGGRALIFNVTRSPFEFTEPPGGFPVTSSNGTSTVPTILRIVLTGVRGVQPNQVTVRFGTTNLTGTAIKAVAPRDLPGFDQLDVQLPASLAGSCNVPVIVTVTISGQTFTSRPAESAPVTSIGPCP